MSESNFTVSAVCSRASFSEDCIEPEIFYDGGWRKVGDWVRYEGARGWRKLFKFKIVSISPEACGKIQLPRWYGRSHGWDQPDPAKRLAVIVGDTICPKSMIQAT